MRVRRIVPAPHVYPSDSDQHLGIWVGMPGLRHKLRHKDSSHPQGPPELSSREGSPWRGRNCLVVHPQKKIIKFHQLFPRPRDPSAVNGDPSGRKPKHRRNCLRQVWIHQGFFQSFMDCNSSMISRNLSARLPCSFTAVKSGLGVCRNARFTFWILAISRLRASTRSRILPSIKRDYICVLTRLHCSFAFTPPWGGPVDRQQKKPVNFAPT
jgi:hypothetical protein